ncbi:MAG: asparaginase domain-containing protein [Methylovulum sp.]|nr:asparaginase domain-containing protein [Methylovulum sp.]
MKQILVVFTGGTIGSTVTEGTINTANTMPFKLLQQFQQHYPKHQQISFTTLEPMAILSENIAPAFWKILIDTVEAAGPEQYDGVIITHGTDTLSYTAAALSFYFHALRVPMLLVSSDYPLDDPRANGLENFVCAVEFIVKENLPGVFVPYRNPQQLTQLHKGTRLASCLQLSGDFISVQGRSYMQFENDRFSLLNPVGNQTHDSIGPLRAFFSERILLIRPYPGLDYRMFNLAEVDVVLHDLYHSGTACVSEQWGENHSLLKFIGHCKSHAINVYLAPAHQSPNAYQSTRFLVERGAVMVWNMSIEAAYVKLALAYGNFTDREKIIAFINSDIAGEHV